MPNLAELKEVSKKYVEAPAETPHEDTSDDDYLQQDLLDALSLLNKCMHLLDYLGDTDLCKSVTKRERQSMSGLSQKVGVFLDNIDGVYDDND